MTQSYQHKMNEGSYYQPEHIWHLDPIPIDQDNFYTLHPYLHHKDFQIKIKLTTITNKEILINFF